MPKLKTFIFPDTYVQDGDLSVCESIEEVHYTKQKIKNRDPEKDKKLEELTRPTIEWEKRMADGDDLFTKERRFLLFTMNLRLTLKKRNL